ncbi:carbon-nitrogen hydrolase family protein [Micromonospora sp. NPDC006431]|uniref:carbon-nitrogen hydrolase family protein n=1 Tax=Micromonospora sp. NPDC006431 TaxID=3364235 RepID=UPI0036CE1E04
METKTNSLVSVAVAQVPSAPGALDRNVSITAAHIRNAGHLGHDLVVFPECTLSGYMFDSPEQTRAAALTTADRRLAALVEACGNADVLAVVGLLELEGSDVYNSALLISGDGILGRYRKQHLPFFGADRFVSPGDDRAPRVIDTSIGRIGLMICFDLRFPESARVPALQGADVIAMPTAWPASATLLAEHFTRVRAVENLVYLAVADRGDEENGTKYLGGSQVVAPTGEVLVRADQREGIFGTDVDLEVARTKRLVFIPGEYELAVFDERKPQHYGVLTQTPEN